MEKHNQPTNYFYCLHLCSYKECRGPKTKILRSHFVRRKARRGMRLIIKSLRTGYGSRVLTSTDTLRADPQPLTSHSLAPLGLSVSLSSSPSLPPCARSVTPSRQPSCRVSQTQREPTSLADPLNVVVLLCLGQFTTIGGQYALQSREHPPINVLGNHPCALVTTADNADLCDCG